MPDIDTLKQRYFVQSADASPPRKPVPATSEDNEITTFVDGKNYFEELHRDINNLGSSPQDEFLYIHAWGIEPDFEIDRSGSGTKLLDVLKDTAKNDVDVRVIGWFSPTLFMKNLPGGGNKLQGFRDVNEETLDAIKDLRTEPKLEKKCCFNTLGHFVGAAHPKLVLVGTDSKTVAYTGGIDPMASRWAERDHAQDNWHDVQAKIAGPAVRDVFDYYRSLWNEILDTASRKFKKGGSEIEAYEQGTPRITTNPGDVDVTRPAKHHVQSVRTVPDKTAMTNSISFAPKGIFEVAGAWEKALSSAREYVYIENYTFKSPDLLDWITSRVKNTTDLKVILLAGAITKYDKWAIRNHLLDPLSSAERERVGIFGRTDDTSGGDPVYVHSKVALVDDQWFFVGSPNCSPRSLYTDFEHAVVALDEDETLAKEVRKNLWREHFGMSSGGPLDDLDEALHVWDSNWGSSGVSPSSSNVTSITSAIGSPQSLTQKETERFEYVIAPDSREWRWLEVLMEMNN